MKTDLFGLDLDAVLFDTASRTLEWVREKYSLQININQMTSWKIQDCTDITDQQALEMWGSAPFYWGACPLPGSVDFTIELNKYYTNVLVTSRSLQVFEVTSQRLRDYSYAYSYLEFDHKKADVAARYGIKLFVDDKYTAVMRLAKVCRTVFLPDYPWNQGDTPRNVVRIDTGWRDGVIQPDYKTILELVT